mgnify:CR=1 FL=1
MNNKIVPPGISQRPVEYDVSNVNFEDVQNGTYTAMDALKDLAKAQEAGTDSATLAYYGNMMFGSSFQTLLPLIKEGSINLDKYSESVATADEQSAKDAAHLADNLNALSASIKNVGIDLVGGISARDAREKSLGVATGARGDEHDS